ncbi:Uncharacterised protein r2_g2397 [Pycnogonum litorale]
MANENDESTLTSHELAILSEVDSRLFGFLRLNSPEHANKKALVVKAVKYLERVLIQHQQHKEKVKKLAKLQHDSTDGSIKAESHVKNIDPRTYCKLGHLHLLLEDYGKSLSSYQKFYSLKEDHWKDTPFLYGMGLVYFHFDAFQW